MLQFRDLNTTTQEGQLLFAALIVLTQSPEIQMNGTRRRGSDMTPDEVLAGLQETYRKITTVKKTG